MFGTLWFAVAACACPRAFVQAAAQSKAYTPLLAAGAMEVRHGRELLASHHFAEAKAVFASYFAGHPADVQAQLGLGDAELGLREYQAAETTYRAAVAQQPELWQAHKNLVVVEAALGRWEDFDGERKILRLARERGAPGISPHESDVIDSFAIGGQRWVVRAYFEPVGRSRARYNFEHFSPTGRVQAYLSLEDAAAAQAALQPGDVHIGAGADPATASGPGGTGEPKSPKLALNWYTGTAHGTIRQYVGGEPAYPQLRREVLAWLHRQPATPVRSGR